MPLFVTTHQIILLAYAGILAAAGWSDLNRYIIPNRVSIALLLLYPAHVMTAGVPVEVWGGVAVAFAAFAVCAGLFACGLMGGGDVKLFAVLALWAGPAAIAPFMLVTAVLGGVLAMVMLSPLGVLLPHPPLSLFKAGLRPGRARQSMPYGVAIAGAGLLLAVELAGR